MSSSNHVKNVAIVGAGGNAGSFIVEALLKTGKHVVSALTRADSTSKLPDGVQVKHVNYEETTTLVEALRGQDALIITMAVTAPPETELKLINAAAESNVPWIIPNFWGGEGANEFVKTLPHGDVRKQKLGLIEKLGKSSHISIGCNFWYEWSLPFPEGFGFNIPKRELTLYDGGELKQPASTFPLVGLTVANLLSLPVHADGPSIDQFRNGVVYVASFVLSQKDMLESVLRVTNTKIADWKITNESSKDRLAAGLEQLKSGNMAGFPKALYARAFFPDGLAERHAEKLDNDVLGLPKEDLDEATKAAIARGNPFEGQSSS